MPFTDLPPEELERYRPKPAIEPDFDPFWAETLALAREYGGSPVLHRTDVGLRVVDTFDVTFPGWAGEPIKGWLILPGGGPAPTTCVVDFQGYGVGRGRVHDHLLYAACGLAHFVVDARGHSRGDTGDRSSVPSGPHEPGFMTQGIHDPGAHYLRRLITDAVRAVDAARQLDLGRIVAAGTSQGGGLALAVAGLVRGLTAVMSDVPFLSDYRRGAQISDRVPYLEISQFLRKRPELTEQSFRTLSYFDAVNFAARADAPALMSVALMDPICPPSTVYAAYHAYAGPKQLEVYEFNEHEGGESLHAMKRVRFAASTGELG